MIQVRVVTAAMSCTTATVGLPLVPISLILERAEKTSALILKRELPLSGCRAEQSGANSLGPTVWGKQSGVDRVVRRMGPGPAGRADRYAVVRPPTQWPQRPYAPADRLRRERTARGLAGDEPRSSADHPHHPGVSYRSPSRPTVTVGDMEKTRSQ